MCTVTEFNWTDPFSYLIESCIVIFSQVACQSASCFVHFWWLACQVDIITLVALKAFQVFLHVSPLHRLANLEITLWEVLFRSLLSLISQDNVTILLNLVQLGFNSSHSLVEKAVLGR
jgi:hypothetical protein